MPKNIYLKILTGIFTVVLVLLLVTKILIEPWVGKKIKTTLNEKYSDYIIDIDKVNISVFNPGIALENIAFSSKREHGGVRDLTGEIASVSVKGISLVKALFKKEADIREVTVSNCRIVGKIPFPEKGRAPKISTLNLQIDHLLFDNIDLAIADTSSAQSYSVKKGVLKVSDLKAGKLDTLSPGIIKQFDFDAEELISVSPDSMYSIKASGIVCSAASNTLFADSFIICPNYKDYDFTSRHEFQTTRIEAVISQVFIHDFSAAAYLKSKNLVSSYIEIGNMEMKAFRDNRKKFQHKSKPAFQDMIYNYPGLINIDSIGILGGNVTYTEHGAKSNEPGRISFNKLNARLYKITNDTIFKTEKAYLKLNAEASLMRKGRMTVLLKGRLFDKYNTFSVNGNLSGMEASELNPMLEKNAFIYATSGKIDAMNFSFTANNARASGHLTLLYHGLDIAVKNKRTDDTTALKEKVTSLIANMKVLDSNPIKGEKVREGVIDQERDPERFLFNYCFKSILSGIKTSLVKSPKK